MSFDLLCATITQQANRLRAGSSLEARCCVQSKISQGIKYKAYKYNQMISTTQPRLSCPQPEIQITALRSSSVRISEKPDTKSPCLRQGWFICNTYKGLCAGGAFVRTCCRLWDSLQRYSLPDGLTKRLLALHTGAAETALPGPG